MKVLKELRKLIREKNEELLEEFQEYILKETLKIQSSFPNEKQIFLKNFRQIRPEIDGDPGGSIETATPPPEIDIQNENSDSINNSKDKNTKKENENEISFSGEIKANKKNESARVSRLKEAVFGGDLMLFSSVNELKNLEKEMNKDSKSQIVNQNNENIKSKSKNPNLISKDMKNNEMLSFQDKKQKSFKIQTNDKQNINFDRCSFSKRSFRSLNKVFCQFDSKMIKRVLGLIEHPNLRIRKRNIIFLQILLDKSISKVHFVEKYAIGFCSGLYLLTRLRYLGNKAGSELDVIFLLEQIKGFVRTLLTKIKLSGEPIFGIPLFYF